MASKRVGKIYKIIINDDFYIGSTFDFDQRVRSHKFYSKTSNQKLYKAIRDNNNKFEMILLYNYECYTDTELRMEERRCYDELKPNLNSQRPYMSKEEFNEVNKQKSKEFYIINKKTVLEKSKQHYIKNKETINERRKQQRLNNRENIRIKQKQHYIKNRETLIEKAKQYRIKNIETILERQKINRDNNKYICGCDSRVLNTIAAIRIHEQTKKHQKYLLEI